MSISKKIFVLYLFIFMGSVISVDMASAKTHDIAFPIVGNTNYSDTFLAYRSGQVDNKHHAIDIFAPKHAKMISPVNGTLFYVGYPQDSWGWYIVIRADDGYEHHFMHINNDNPGTDDGNGGPMNAYAADMKKGLRVTRGQHIGYVGDSGNAETTPAHLHYEIVKPEYTSQSYSSIPLEGYENPYDSLNAAQHYAVPTTYPQLSGENLPFGQYANNPVSIASGDMNGDKQKEYIVGAGSGYPQVRIYNKDDSVYSWGFPAYAENYTGGVNVASGDIDGDGVDEIVTGTNPGSTTHVRIFKADGSVMGGFFAYDGYNTGVNVAVADMDGDGKAEIITGTGPGSTTHIKIFKADGTYMNGNYGFFAYPGYYIGSDVAAGDVDGDGINDIVTSTTIGSTAHVKVFNANGIMKNGFFAYDNFYGGTEVSVANIDTSNAKLEIITAPRSMGGPDFRVFDNNGGLLKSGSTWESWWSGGYGVTPIDSKTLKVSTGDNRRSSIRTINLK